MTNNSWRNDKITDKQKSLIEQIETILDIEFEGTTKGEASDFISENIKEAQRESLDMVADYYGWENDH